jgi:hypothetical protein
LRDQRHSAKKWQRKADITEANRVAVSKTLSEVQTRYSQSTQMLQHERARRKKAHSKLRYHFVLTAALSNTAAAACHVADELKGSSTPSIWTTAVLNKSLPSCISWPTGRKNPKCWPRKWRRRRCARNQTYVPRTEYCRHVRDFAEHCITSGTLRRQNSTMPSPFFSKQIACCFAPKLRGEEP